MMGCPECNLGVITMVDALTENSATDYDFLCSARCGWQCGDPARAAAYRAKIKAELKTPKPTKKVKPYPGDTPEEIAFIRSECDDASARLLAERAKFPPTNIMVGKGKKAHWVPNPDFTQEMFDHMHTFAYSAEDIRKEMKS